MRIGPPAASREGGALVLRAKVISDGTEDECFYSVPEAFAAFADTESSNCFLAGLLYPAMRRGEDLHVGGTVSEKLLFDVNEFLVPLMAECDPRIKRIAVTADATDPRGCPGARAVGTGFSGGVDSFFTILERFARPVPEGFRLTHLFFFNVGAHGIPRGPGDEERIAAKFRARYGKLRAFPDEIGLPFVPVDSNVHRFHPWGHLETATLATASAVLFLQRGIHRYYLASAGHPHGHLWRFLGAGRRPDDIAFLNPLLLPWLSTETTEFIDDGTAFDRSRKTEAISTYGPAARHLNVCGNADTIDTNCSVCPKCCRTMLTLELLGRLGDFSGVFDIARYRREARRLYIAQVLVNRARDPFNDHLLDLARERGVDLRREVNALDLFRARMLDGRLHAFIRNNRLLKAVARKCFRS